MPGIRAVFALSLLAAGVACAEDSSVEQRLKAMEARMEQLAQENQALRVEVQDLKARTAAPAAQPGGPAGQPTGTPAPVDPKKPLGLSASWKDDFWLKSDDGNFTLHPGGIIEAQGRFFTSEERASDTFFLREARLVAEGAVYKDFDYTIVGDFGKSSAVLKQAWAGWKKYPYLSFRMGEMKQPFSLENMNSSLFVDFCERSPQSLLANEYEIGAQLYGKAWEERLEYNLGVFNGGAQNTSDLNDGKDLVAHLVVKPFAPSDDMWLKGIRIGGSVTYGAQKQPFTSLAEPDSGTTFLTALANTRVAEERTRWNVEGAWIVGPVRLQGEATFMTQGMERITPPTGSTAHDDVDFTSWYVEGVWSVTGDDAVIGRRHPKKNFLQDGGIGDIEFAFRFSRFDVDEEIFDNRYADRSLSTDGFDNYIGGVNWWFNPNVRFTVDYFHNEFDDPVTINREQYDSEDGFITRFQLDF